MGYIGQQITNVFPTSFTVTNATVEGAFTSQGIDDNADATAMTITSAEKIGIGTTSPDTESLVDLGSGENSGFTRKLLVTNTGTSRAGFGALSNLFRVFYADDQILQFGTMSRDGNYTYEEKMRLDNSDPARLYINTTTVRNAGLVNIDFDTGSHGAFGINDTNSGNGGVFIGFLSGGTFRGSITNNNNTAVAFNTTSDYRLKESVKYDWEATTRLKKLKPINFNFIADKDNTIDGFLAHEVQEVVPQAVTGTKDETKTSKNVVLDKDENIIGIDKTKEDWENGKKNGTYDDDTSWKASITQKQYQQIDHSKLVPLLVKSLQEALAEIDTLKTKVSALENK